MALIVTINAQLQPSIDELESLDFQSKHAFNAAESDAVLALTRIVPKDLVMGIDRSACSAPLYEQDFSAGRLSDLRGHRGL